MGVEYVVEASFICTLGLRMVLLRFCARGLRESILGRNCSDGLKQHLCISQEAGPPEFRRLALLRPAEGVLSVLHSLSQDCDK
jgi:hypothetical protein